MIGGIGTSSVLPSQFTSRHLNARIDGSEKSGGFKQNLADAINKVNELQLQADEATRALLTGEDVDIHDVMLATEKAALAMELTIQIRNKAIEAYQEVMRMQI